MSIKENIYNIYKKIEDAAVKVGRNPEAVKVLAATKTITSDKIEEAVKAGIKIIGENKVQEAKEKIEVLKYKLPEFVSWHMIGHLQRNKAKLAVQLFDLIHSIDSLKLAEKVNKVAAEFGKVQKVLIQVKLSDEETKYGISPDEIINIIEKIYNMENISVEGLMTMPPYFENPENVRTYFKRLRKLRDELQSKGFSLPELSMGMSGDFEIAVEEGATIVRIGSAIFGRRNYK